MTVRQNISLSGVVGAVAAALLMPYSYTHKYDLGDGGEARSKVGGVTIQRAYFPPGPAGLTAFKSHGMGGMLVVMVGVWVGVVVSGGVIGGGLGFVWGRWRTRHAEPGAAPDPARM